MLYEVITGEENKLIEKDPSFKARRWVVELAHSWFKPVSQIDTAIRENGSLIYCAQHIGGRDDCLEQDHGYL